MDLSENERVEYEGETYAKGDKVYSINAMFGVGYIQKLRFHGVHFAPEALIDSIILDEPKWVSAKNFSKDITDSPSWEDIDGISQHH